MVAFKNPRNQVGMRTVVLQAFPTEWSHILNIFRECTQRRLFDAGLASPVRRSVPSVHQRVTGGRPNGAL